jgi:hypothetical protein
MLTLVVFPALENTRAAGVDAAKFGFAPAAEAAQNVAALQRALDGGRASTG